jgi:hypothetical protein
MLVQERCYSEECEERDRHASAVSGGRKRSRRISVIRNIQRRSNTVCDATQRDDVEGQKCVRATEWKDRNGAMELCVSSNAATTGGGIEWTTVGGRISETRNIWKRPMLFRRDHGGRNVRDDHVDTNKYYRYITPSFLKSSAGRRSQRTCAGTEGRDISKVVQRTDETVWPDRGTT